MSMSTGTIDSNQLQLCDRCQRRYHIDVYQRHINENQCLKRNHHRLPFQSIKQRTIRIGDRIYSVQPGKKSEPVHQRVTTISTVKPEAKKLFSPSNGHRRPREEAKLLLERRIRYKPPWIQQRTTPLKPIPRKDLEELPMKDLHLRSSSPPRTRFLTDDLPIRVHRPAPILTQSPKLSRIVVQEMSPMTRKANTWTRPSKGQTARRAISPIHIPTYFEAGSIQPKSINRNENDDDDEFERYSPTPPSTPRLPRPITYQKSKRTELPPLKNVRLPAPHSKASSIAALRPWR